MMQRTRSIAASAEVPYHGQDCSIISSELYPRILNSHLSLGYRTAEMVSARC